MGMENDLDVRALRKKLGWSQQKLAFEVGVSHAAISRLENGHVKLSGPIRKLLADLAANPPGGSLPETGGASASPSFSQQDEAA
jgi:transcriptional regulator with XRE-family HTH domain